jgi:hypothetical protein
MSAVRGFWYLSGSKSADHLYIARIKPIVRRIIARNIKIKLIQMVKSIFKG